MSLEAQALPYQLRLIAFARTSYDPFTSIHTPLLTRHTGQYAFLNLRTPRLPRVRRHLCCGLLQRVRVRSPVPAAHHDYFLTLFLQSSQRLRPLRSR